MTYTAVKGMHDLLPPQSDRWVAMEAAVRAVCAVYGFGEIRTPVVEKTALFARGVGETTSVVEKEMYTFTDQGEEQLSLRPEGTAAVVRAYIESGVAMTDPLAKYYYLGPMFRRERPQKGRYRQFHQFGIESLGSTHPHADIEVIALLLRFLHTVGLPQVRLEINSLGCPHCRPAYCKVLERLLGKVREELCAECHRRLEKNPLRVLDCKHPSCRKVLEEVPTIADYWCAACTTHFQAVRDGLDALALPYILNPRIARGLDYYMRTAFEVVAEGLGAQNAVAGGGRYDGLVKALGGPEVAGVGVAVGLERLMLVLQELHAPAAPALAFVAAVGPQAQARALPLIEAWRTAGDRIEWDYEGRSLKSQMRRADKLGAHTVIILGDEELKAGTATIRNMRTKTQETVPLEKVSEHLKSEIRSTKSETNTKLQ